MSADGTKKTITISWNPNPKAEHVDAYALYYRGGFSEQYQITTFGIMFAVTKNTSIQTQLISAPTQTSSDPYEPYGSNQIPISVDDSNGGSFEANIWVIAHNKNGWGNNDYATPNPDENPANFSEDSLNQANRAKPPTTFDLTNTYIAGISPDFSSTVWPISKPQSKFDEYEFKLQSAPISPWTVPWLPRMDIPSSRFQSGRPSDVKGLKVAKFDPKTHIFKLTWVANPASDHVDSYAIYSTDGCGITPCQNSLVAITKTNKFQAKYVLLNSNPGKFSNWPYPTYTNGIIQFAAPRVHNTMWVIAHNSRGWGNNHDGVPNPDISRNDYKLLTYNQLATFPDPKGWEYVEVP